MKLKEIYDLAVRIGIDADPRGKQAVNKMLKRVSERYEKMDADEKDFFDTEKLTNPFADTRILAGDLDMTVTGIMCGIDLEAPEILLADRLNQDGAKINLILTHHPEGRGLVGLSEVMPVHADIWERFGVPINVGDALMDARMREVYRGIMPLNHNRPVDAARLLGFAYMCCHTPADNMVAQLVQKHLDKKKPTYLREVVKALREIPEYAAAAKDGAGPTIVVGDGEKRCGKVMVDMTGGTEPPEAAIEKLSRAGVGTMVCMHVSDKIRKKAEENQVNIVIAGHIASDAVGLNQILDKIEGPRLKVIACSGLVRVKRGKGLKRG